MTALATARDTVRQGEHALTDYDNYPIAAATKVYAGGLGAVLNGYLQPAGNGGVIVGRITKTVDNTSGSAGALNVDVERGTFPWANSSGADLIAQANVLQLAYAVDDQTAALTDGGGTRSPIGPIKSVDSTGVYIETAGIRVAETTPKLVIPFYLDLASITASGQAVGSFVPGFAGRILKTLFIVDKPATTAAKSITLQPRIATVAVTGGLVSLTSANSTPKGAVIAGSAVTALNVFTAAQAIDVQAAVTAAFAEGSGTLYLYLG